METAVRHPDALVQGAVTGALTGPEQLGDWIREQLPLYRDTLIRWDRMSAAERSRVVQDLADRGLVNITKAGLVVSLTHQARIVVEANGRIKRGAHIRSQTELNSQKPSNQRSPSGQFPPPAIDTNESMPSSIKNADPVLFGKINAKTRDEEIFLRSLSTTFKNSSIYRSATRFEGNIIVQRSDIPLSIQNIRRMAGGNIPFILNSQGEWEIVNLHHIGRQKGKIIEVLQSHNIYSPNTGGPLHIPGPGGLVRDSKFSAKYWKQRLIDFIQSGHVHSEMIEGLGK